MCFFDYDLDFISSVRLDGSGADLHRVLDFMDMAEVHLLKNPKFDFNILPFNFNEKLFTRRSMVDDRASKRRRVRSRIIAYEVFPQL